MSRFEIFTRGSADEKEKLIRFWCNFTHWKPSLFCRKTEFKLTSLKVYFKFMIIASWDSSERFNTNWNSLEVIQIKSKVKIGNKGAEKVKPADNTL